MIHKNWTSLIKPKEIDAGKESDLTCKAVFVVAPLERGFGTTLGNALRRVLLSSLRGGAVTSVQIEGVLHEFSSVPGILEDVTDLILNVKGLSLKMNAEGPETIRLHAEGEGVVTAGMIECGHTVEIIDPDYPIATLNAEGVLNLSMEVISGKGYVPAAHAREGEKEVGTVGKIPVDANFSPVKRVSWRTESMRVGQKTDYDKLILDIETNGAITPEDALGVAAKILQSQLEVFINFEEVLVSEDDDENSATDWDMNLFRKVDELELSVRSANCLKNDDIIYIGDLVQKTEAQMLKTPNFGRKSLQEIKEVLDEMNLTFGIEMKDWPPSNLEDLAKQMEEYEL